MSGDIIPVVSHGIVIDETYLDELEALIVMVENEMYEPKLAADLLALEGEVVVWQYRNGIGSEQ